LLFAIFFA